MFSNPFHDENQLSADTSDEEMLGNMTQQSVEQRYTEDIHVMSHKGFHNPFGLEPKQENDMQIHSQIDHLQPPSMHNIVPENIPRPSVKDLIKVYESKKVEKADEKAPDVPAEGRGSVKDLINKFEKRAFNENKNFQSGNGNNMEARGSVGTMVQEIETRIAENEHKRNDFQLLNVDNRNQDFLSDIPRRTANFGDSGSGSSSLQNVGHSHNELEVRGGMDKSVSQEFLADITEDDESLNLSTYTSKPMMNNPIGLNQSYLAGNTNRSDLDISRSKLNYSNISHHQETHSQFTDYRTQIVSTNQLQFHVDPQTNFDQQHMDLRVNQFDDHVLSQVTEDTQDLSHLTMMQFQNGLYQKDNSLYLNMTALNQSNVSGMNRSHMRDKSQEFNKSMNQSQNNNHNRSPSLPENQHILMKTGNILNELNIAQQVLDDKPRPTASFGNFGAMGGLQYPEHEIKNVFEAYESTTPIFHATYQFYTSPAKKNEIKAAPDVHNLSPPHRTDIVYKKGDSFGAEKPLSHTSTSPAHEIKYEEMGKISPENTNVYTMSPPLVNTENLRLSTKASEVMKSPYEGIVIREDPVERHSPTNFYTDVKIAESFVQGSPKLERAASGPTSPSKVSTSTWQIYKDVPLPTFQAILSKSPSYEFPDEIKIPTLAETHAFTSIHSNTGNKLYEIPNTGTTGATGTAISEGLYSSNLLTKDYHNVLSPSKVASTNIPTTTHYDFHSLGIKDDKYSSLASYYNPFEKPKDIKGTDLYTESWKTSDLYGKTGIGSTYDYRSSPITSNFALGITPTGYQSSIVEKKENSPGLYSMNEKTVESVLKSYSPITPVQISSTSPYISSQDNMYIANYQTNVVVKKPEMKVPLKLRKRQRSKPQILNLKGTLTIPLETELNFVIPTNPKEYAAVNIPFCKANPKNTRKKFFGLKVKKEKFMRAINERKVEKEGLEIVCSKCLGHFNINQIDTHSLTCYSYGGQRGETDEIKVVEDVEELNRKLREIKRKIEDKLKFEQNVGWQFSDIATLADKVIRENYNAYLVQDSILDINRKIDELVSGDPVKSKPVLIALVKRVLVISKQKLSKIELANMSETDLLSLKQKSQIYQKEILALKPPMAIYQYQADMIQKISLGPSSKHVKATYHYEPKPLLDIESDVALSDNEEKNQVLTSSVRSKKPLQFDSGPGYKKSSENAATNKKIHMYSMAVSYKLGLPPGHPGKNAVVGELYNEFMSKNLPEVEWPMFLKSKFTTA